MSATTYASNTRHAESTRHRRTRIVSGHERPPAGRALLEVVALIAIAILLIAGVVLTSGRVHAAGPTQRVFVERGQTLWAIASQHAVAGQTTEQTAQQIADLNGVRNGRVIAGVTIAIPAEQTDHVLTASR